jgi:AcrR family transcriptional regulator
VKRLRSDTRNHIVAITSKLLATATGAELRITDIARAANVAIPTIYYHFESRGQLIAQAQVFYLQAGEANPKPLIEAETAINARSEEQFWQTIERLIIGLSVIDSASEDLALPIRLVDVWSDEAALVEYREAMNSHLERWKAVVEEAQIQGWLKNTFDPSVPFALVWALSLGHALLPARATVSLTPAMIQTIFVNTFGQTREGTN